MIEHCLPFETVRLIQYTCMVCTPCDSEQIFWMIHLLQISVLVMRNWLKKNFRLDPNYVTMIKKENPNVTLKIWSRPLLFYSVWESGHAECRQWMENKTAIYSPQFPMNKIKNRIWNNLLTPLEFSPRIKRPHLEIWKCHIARYINQTSKKRWIEASSTTENCTGHHQKSLPGHN